GAAPPQADRLEPAGALRQVTERVLELAVGLLLDQQPDRSGPGALPRRPPLARPDPQPGEPAPHRPLGPLPPGDLPPRRPRRQLLAADRPWRILGQPVPLPRGGTGAGPRGGATRAVEVSGHVIGDASDGGDAPAGQPIAG